MTVPKRPPHDAKAANNAWKTLRKPDGTEFSVFGSGSYVDFVQWTDALRNEIEALRVQVNGADGLKKHIDRIDTREASHHAAQAAKIAALEAVVASGGPFPG